VIDILDWTINVGVPQLTGWIINEGKDLWAWIKSKMGLGGGPADPGGTGGPEPGGSPISITDWAIDVAEPAVTGWISGLASGLYGWLHDKLFGGGGAPDGTGGPEPGGSSSFKYTISGIVFDILEPLINLKSGDVTTWVQAQVDTLGEIKAQLDNWSIAITGAPTFSFGGGGGTAGGGSGGGINLLDTVNKKLKEWSDAINGENGLVIDATNWVMQVDGTPNPKITNASEWSTAVSKARSGIPR
jgi:hypothetical protein